jgi:hypothetical protein
MSILEVLERLLIQHQSLTRSEIYSCVVFICDHPAEVKEYLEQRPEDDQDIGEEWNDDDFLARYYMAQGEDLREAYQDDQDDNLLEAA